MSSAHMSTAMSAAAHMASATMSTTATAVVLRHRGSRNGQHQCSGGRQSNQQVSHDRYSSSPEIFVGRFPKEISIEDRFGSFSFERFMRNRAFVFTREFPFSIESGLWRSCSRRE